MSGVDSQIGEASSSAGPSTSAPANSSSSSYMNRFKKLHAQRVRLISLFIKKMC